MEGFAAILTQPIDATWEAHIVRNAWKAAIDKYEIGLVSGNRPVTVYSRADGTHFWGPGPLWDAQKFVELKAAQAVIDALNQ
jgi:hypothetical protein